MSMQFILLCFIVKCHESIQSGILHLQQQNTEQKLQHDVIVSNDKQTRDSQ